MNEKFGKTSKRLKYYKNDRMFVFFSLLLLSLWHMNVDVQQIIFLVVFDFVFVNQGDLLMQIVVLCFNLLYHFIFI